MNASSKILSGFKYGYLVVFFALLSGIFYPIISQTSFEPVISGILVLFVGLAGGVFVVQSYNIRNKKRNISWKWICLNWNFVVLYFSINWKSLDIKVKIKFVRMWSNCNFSLISSF